MKIFAPLVLAFSLLVSVRAGDFDFPRETLDLLTWAESPKLIVASFKTVTAQLRGPNPPFGEAHRCKVSSHFI